MPESKVSSRHQQSILVLNHSTPSSVWIVSNKKPSATQAMALVLKVVPSERKFCWIIWMAPLRAKGSTAASARRELKLRM
jgi:hypothetical protein